MIPYYHNIYGRCISYLFKGDLYNHYLFRGENFVEKNSLWAEAIYWFYITIIFMVDLFFIDLKEISIFIIYSEATILWRKNNLWAEEIYWLYITIELISRPKNKGLSPIISPFKSINLKLEIKWKNMGFSPIISPLKSINLKLKINGKIGDFRT